MKWLGYALYPTCFLKFVSLRAFWFSLTSHSLATSPHEPPHNITKTMLLYPCRMLSLQAPGSSEALSPAWLRSDLQAVAVVFPRADAELRSQDHRYMQQDETCSDSRFAPRVHYHRLTVKFLICPQLQCSSTQPQLGWNISFPLLISKFQSSRSYLIPNAVEDKGQEVIHVLLMFQSILQINDATVFNTVQYTWSIIT